MYAAGTRAPRFGELPAKLAGRELLSAAVSSESRYDGGTDAGQLGPHAVAGQELPPLWDPRVPELDDHTLAQLLAELDGEDTLGAHAQAAAPRSYAADPAHATSSTFEAVPASKAEPRAFAETAANANPGPAAQPARNPNPADTPAAARETPPPPDPTAPLTPPAKPAPAIGTLSPAEPAQRRRAMPTPRTAPPTEAAPATDPGPPTTPLPRIGITPPARPTTPKRVDATHHADAQPPHLEDSAIGPVIHTDYGDFRPPIDRVREPALTGLTRRSRSRLGSLLFTIAFVAIFLIILIETLVSLLSAGLAR